MSFSCFFLTCQYLPDEKLWRFCCMIQDEKGLNTSSHILRYHVLVAFRTADSSGLPACVNNYQMIHFNSHFPVKISIFLNTRTCHFANLLILLSKPKLAHSLNFMFAFRILLTPGLGSTKCLPIWEGHFNPQNGLADMKTYLESLTTTE